MDGNNLMSLTFHQQTQQKHFHLARSHFLTQPRWPISSPLGFLLLFIFIAIAVYSNRACGGACVQYTSPCTLIGVRVRACLCEYVVQCCFRLEVISISRPTGRRMRKSLKKKFFRKINIYLYAYVYMYMRVDIARYV